MNRQPLLEMLERYQRRWPDEAGTVGRIRDLVVAHEDCFERTCRPGHITASAWVVTADGSKSLLVHHRKLSRWLQPGGHADGDPNVAAVALREANEETGLPGLELAGDTTATPLDVDVHLIPARHDEYGSEVEDAHEHHDIRFLITAPVDSPPIVSDESHDVRWFDSRAIEQVTSEESVLRLQRKCLLLKD